MGALLAIVSEPVSYA